MSELRRHIVLVGLPGAGKTTVGKLVADQLGAPFADFDREVERRAGRRISQIFKEQGESSFRVLEATVGTDLLCGPPSVLAPGGGFFNDVEQRGRTLERGYAIYLETSPVVAARRLDGTDDRPLLRGFEPALRLRQLLEQRQAAYLEAQGKVTTDSLSPADVAARIVELARAHGGW